MLNQIQYVKIPQSPALNVFTENKLDTLRERYEFIQDIQVFFKLENTTPGYGRICEIECSIPGSKIHARASKEYFEHAVKTAVNEIMKQLEKKKASLQAF
ncbi:MAG: HPF/RaiA family ribosome-associated protein [Christiangramia sp.]